MSTKKRKYPYKAWVVMPAGGLKEVTLVKEYESYWKDWHGDVSETGKSYSLNELHATPKEAIDAAHRALNEQQRALDKRQSTISKKRRKLIEQEKLHGIIDEKGNVRG